MVRVGQNHTFIGIYGAHTVFLAGKSPYIRSYTVQIYGSGQPFIYGVYVYTVSIYTYVYIRCIYGISGRVLLQHV
jgi:hypothetical protein